MIVNELFISAKSAIIVLLVYVSLNALLSVLGEGHDRK